MQDAELFEHNVPAVEVAVRLRATAKPAYAKETVACLRERVGVLGGDFSTGPEADGGFAVRARIPS